MSSSWPHVVRALRRKFKGLIRQHYTRTGSIMRTQKKNPYMHKLLYFAALCLHCVGFKIKISWFWAKSVVGLVEIFGSTSRMSGFSVQPQNHSIGINQADQLIRLLLIYYWKCFAVMLKWKFINVYIKNKCNSIETITKKAVCILELNQAFFLSQTMQIKVVPNSTFLRKQRPGIDNLNNSKSFLGQNVSKPTKSARPFKQKQNQTYVSWILSKMSSMKLYAFMKNEKRNIFCNIMALS